MPSNSRLGWAWVGLAIALALHVADEALTGFLSVYNPTVLALRQSFPRLPLPVFRFDVWLAGLIAVVLLLLAASPFAFQAGRSTRYRKFFPIAYFLAILMIFNALGHTAGSIFGRTVDSVRFARPMPGFYSSPLLLAAALYLLAQLRKVSPIQRSP